MLDEKGLSLLNFLKANATLRRRRVSSYGSEDKVLWLADVPKERAECRSPFLIDNSDDLVGFWLEVRKKRVPARPPVPQVVADWVRAEDLDQWKKEPELLPEITVIVKRQVPDPNAPQDPQKTIVEEVPEVRRLADHPEVEEAWLEYLIEKWEPWVHEMRQWDEIQRVYETLDFMYRRLEEAEERYELVLAIGFLQWRDPTGVAVARHVLTAPAELTLDAARGVLTVAPSASFVRFRVELDMLDPQHQPRVDNEELLELCEELDIQAWDINRVKPILSIIANSLSANAQVRETYQRADRVEERPLLSFAPALVLRKRRSTAYDDLLDRFQKAAARGILKTTQPWRRLLQEGESPSTGASTACEDNTPVPVEISRYLFPLPTNEEQRQIVQRLETDPCVLVKGPPGTGKSHTIANLICHLLARGERVLVTAHAPKALAVLRDLLPGDIRDLCVTALGSSREEQRLLEESVGGIERRWNAWRGPEEAQRAIKKAEKELGDLEGELAQVERDLRAFREAETHSHDLPVGYSGTAAQIARRLNEQEQEFGWFPELSTDDPFPLDSSESAFLVEAHARFTADARAKLELEIGDVELPNPEEFQALVVRLTEAERSPQRVSKGVDGAKLEFLESVKTEQLRGLRQAVQELSSLALLAGKVWGDVAESEIILGDLLAGVKSRWSSLAADCETLLKDAEQLVETIGSIQVELPDGISEDQIRTDVERRLAHFEAGGWKGLFILAPRVVRETNYITKRCRINGKKVKGIEQLRLLRDYLELYHKLRELRCLLGASLGEVSTPRKAISRARELTALLRELLVFFDSEKADLMATVLGPNRTALASAYNRDEWLRAIAAQLALSEARDAQQELGRLLERVRSFQHSSKVHPCLSALGGAIRTRDPAAWRTAWQERERVRQEKEHLARYDSLLERLDRFCPGLAELLRSTAGDPAWRDKLLKLGKAWNWAAARAWVRRVSNATAYEARGQDYPRLKQKIEKATEKLVSLRAWKAFFDRLDEKTVQNLHAWKDAVRRIGKGTGKHASSHRRAAQSYLKNCIPYIPAWIMPLHKLWDSVSPEPGLFDTVIVDEASQAGIDALVLLLLAKRIVVVGDDKQNSPEAVGVLEDDIARLIKEHLNAFRFRYEFRPDTSLFDHAQRAFRTRITLREHFRCVPEIIRFSNDLCYRDAPLDPLRQPPPKRLPPLRSRFVAEGACEGEGPRIRNRAEADAIVETIVELVNDPAYTEKTMGVIALQGHAQAQLIEKLLAERLHPKVIEERRLRCGEPATFQGDERDIIFLSLVIAPNVNYRALTSMPDQRRFNVAMSRARDQVWLFHSVQAHDLSPDDLRLRLLSFLEVRRQSMLFSRISNASSARRGGHGVVVTNLNPMRAGSRWMWPLSFCDESIAFAHRLRWQVIELTLSSKGSTSESLSSAMVTSGTALNSLSTTWRASGNSSGPAGPSCECASRIFMRTGSEP